MPYSEETIHAVAQALVYWRVTDILAAIAAALVATAACNIATTKWRERAKTPQHQYAWRGVILVASILAASAALSLARHGRFQEAERRARRILEVAGSGEASSMGWTNPKDLKCSDGQMDCEPTKTLITIKRADTEDSVTLTLDEARRARQALMAHGHHLTAFSLLGISQGVKR